MLIKKDYLYQFLIHIDGVLVNFLRGSIFYVRMRMEEHEEIEKKRRGREVTFSSNHKP